MRALFSLQRSLFRRQRRQVALALEAAPAPFRAYEARYRRRTRRFEHELPEADVAAAAQRSDLVYVGDYHTLPEAQERFLWLVQRCRESGRRVVIALEFVEGRHQHLLDAFLEGKLHEPQLARELGHERGPGTLWHGFWPILELARRERIAIAAIDRRASGRHSLALRDAYAAERLSACAMAVDRPLVIALVGQFHVAPPHLPRATRERLGATERRHLVVYQNCEGVYWRLAEAGRASSVTAVQIRQGELCLVHTSPVLCQQSFLDYLERERGDERLSAKSTSERFFAMVRLIADAARVPFEKKPPVSVFISPDALIAHVRKADACSARELRELKRCALEREGLYVPEAEAVFLGTLSLNTAAEEAAHLVRNLAAPGAMERLRRPADAFYARCLEEALGFLGSKLVNPRRRAPSLESWLRTFRTSKGELKHIAAFVIAHKSLEGTAAREVPRLIPLHRDRVFHAVSHALGYQLGERLYAALEQEDRPEALVWLFRDPFDDAQTRYFELLRECSLRPAEPGPANDLKASALS